MTAQNIEDIYPLSPMQQGMLFHSIMDAENDVYTGYTTCKLFGELDLVALERAWQRVVAHHGILRTAFVWEGVDEPLQVVQREVNVPFTVLDWRHLDATDQETRLNELLESERLQGFQLADAPLLRILVIHLNENVYQFIWLHHHLILDGWTLPIILKDVFFLYEAMHLGQDMYPTPGRPFRDYIAWLQEQDIADAERFWRATLKGFTRPNSIFSGKTASVRDQKTVHRLKEITLTNGYTDKLQSLVRQHQLTMNTMVQGAWALLLHRYTGDHDIVFGATVSGRPAELTGVETMVGLFINTLPVRIQISEKQPLVPWLKQIQNQVVQMRQFEYSPLVQIQSWSEVPGNLPLFSSILVFENYPVSEELGKHEGSLQLREVRSLEQTNYPLTVVAGVGLDLKIKISYDSAIYNDDAIMRMLLHLRKILEGMADFSDETIAAVPMLTKAEIKQLLIDWNNTAKADTRLRQPVYRLIESQVKQSPDAIAIQFQDQEMDYQTLNMRANQVAHYLQSLQVGPGQLVGLYIDRCLEMMIGLLGILKSGAAYLPLDPGYPRERLAFMLQDSGTQVVLSLNKFADVIPANGAQIIFLDRQWPEIDRMSHENIQNSFSLDHPAYVIYTSGSTGIPKGVMVPHRALVNHALAMQEMYGVQLGDRMLQFISLSFDASGEEFYPTLISGATLVLHPAITELEGAAMLAFCQEQNIHLLHLPAAFWHQWVDALTNQPKPLQSAFKVLLVGGESPSLERLKTWQALTEQKVKMINAYGPTETTITATAYLAEGKFQIPDFWSALPIGKPIANVQVFLLDGQMQPVPVGVPGELYIGGIGVANGYLNRPDLTAERFIPNPFSVDSGDRLYRTGDLVRFLTDGNIEFIGRVDNQVKIRGFRIELEEIESAMIQFPQVKDAVVLARPITAPGGDLRLTAYLVPVPAAVIDVNALRQFIKDRLPEYMVPASYMVLESLPLLPNGKVDRHALPESDASALPQEEFVAPRTLTEELLANIWSQVLGLEQVSSASSFFELGGHSLLATRMASRVREAFRIDLPIKAIFENPTIQSLAQKIDASGSDASLTEPPFLPIPRDAGHALPLSFAQQRLWFLDQLAPGGTFYNIPTAVQLVGQLNLAAFERSIQALVQRHESMRTSFSVIDGRPVQIVHPDLSVKPRFQDLSELVDDQKLDQARELATEEIMQSFDLAQGPLFRVLLLRLDEQSHIVVLTMHHIISDGWSIGILIQELAQFYQAFVLDSVPSLPELSIQYADFAHWQRNWLQGQVLESQLNYWREKLAGIPPVLELPLDRPRPAIQSFNGAQHPVRIAGSVARALKALSQQESVTLFMTLLAAFQTLLHRYSGQDDICVGTPIANRVRKQTEPIIGFFINTLVMRSNFAENPSFRELLMQVREVTLGAYAHQDIPFEKLVEAIQPGRDLSHSPLFQVVFVLQNLPAQEIALPELTIKPFSISNPTSQFDLTLMLMEGEDGLGGSIEYNTDLFDPTTVERMAGHFDQLLEAIIANPDQNIGALELLTAPETSQILQEWNDLSLHAPEVLAQTFHQLFESRVQQQPDAIAAVYENDFLTYAQLNRQANQLASFLRRKGVGPDVIVGICTERSLEMVVGLMGILKAGGAYLPLDPLYPRERLAYMLEDSQAPVLLTQQRLLATLPEHRASVVCLDNDWSEIAREMDDNPGVRMQPENLAYVIYTSGSTGKPKGVMLRHRGYCNLAEAQRRAFGIGIGNNVLQFSSFSFDASAWEMSMTLYAGATFHLAHQDKLVPGPDMVQLLRERQINSVTLPPSILAALPENELPALQMIVAAGEALPGELVNRWTRNGRRIYNAYGPTEVTVCASYKLCMDAFHTSPPIGRPITNAQLYVLDRYFNPVPVGVPGELYVGGEGLARGYLGRPDLTGASFIPNPFGRQAGTRLYKTGDLVRFLINGDIEFLGRIDHQVKVRGFRIELGEIEAVLGKHPDIQESVVLAREDVIGDRRLVAYLVAGEATPDIGTLRAYLKENLPDYMIPSAFVFLPEFPLTPNGKVDRRALPAPDQSAMKLTTEYVAPRNESEQKLAEICSQILNLERVGVYDNFFELGGHSLLATQFVSRVRDAFNIELPLRSLFEKPTIAELVMVIDQARAMGVEHKVSEIKRVAREDRRLKRSEIAGN